MTSIQETNITDSKGFLAKIQKKIITKASIKLNQSNGLILFSPFFILMKIVNIDIIPVVPATHDAIPPEFSNWIINNTIIKTPYVTHEQACSLVLPVNR